MAFGCIAGCAALLTRDLRDRPRRYNGHLPKLVQVRLLATVLSALSALAGTASLAFAGSPMATDGQASVTPVGGAIYTIPIEVPPGTRGLAPALSLNYSSFSGNGLLGGRLDFDESSGRRALLADARAGWTGRRR
jgi:hypothetical protein